MSMEKKLQPIQPQPVRPFTIRLVDGHFVRVPKVENVALTDATRPPSTLKQETSPHGDGTVITRRLQLINGRFVGGAASAPVQVPPAPAAGVTHPAPAQPTPVPPRQAAPDSWAYAFRTQLDPSDFPPET